METKTYYKAMVLLDKMCYIKGELNKIEKMKSVDIIRICNFSLGDNTTVHITDSVCFPHFKEHILAECKQMLQNELEATIKEFEKL